MLFSENPDQLIDELKDYIQIASSYDCSPDSKSFTGYGKHIYNRSAWDQAVQPDRKRSDNVPR